MTQPTPARPSAPRANHERSIDALAPRGALLPRSRFLGLTAAAAAGTVGWIAAGCFGDDDKPASQPSPTAAAAPGRGGRLRVTQPGDLILASGHPFALVPQNRILAYAAHETLVQYNDSLTPTPLLAERFEVTPDFRRVVVTLKPDLEFHNGTPVTSDDVVFSVEAVRDPSTAGLPPATPFELAGFARMVTDIKVADQRTVEFTLDGPRANIADFFAQLHIAQRSSFPRGEVVGTGPFKLTSRDQGRAYTLERFDKWHGAGPDGRPYLDAIEVRVYSDAATAAAAFRAGDLDVSLTVSAPDAAQLLGTAQARIAGKTGINYLGVNVMNPLLSDHRVRQAIFYALDRAQILSDAGHNFGDVTSQPWAPSSPAFDPGREAPLYDPARAMRLLEQAGFQQAGQLTIEYAAMNALQEVQAQLIQANLQAVGIQVRLQGVESVTYSGRYRSREFPDFWLAGTLAGDLTPATMLQQTFEFRPSGNLSHFEDAAYSDLVARLTGIEARSPEAQDIYRQLNQLMLDNPFVIPTGIPQARIDLVQDKVKGWPVKPEDYAIAVTGKVDFSKVWLQ